MDLLWGDISVGVGSAVCHMRAGTPPRSTSSCPRGCGPGHVVIVLLLSLLSFKLSKDRDLFFFKKKKTPLDPCLEPSSVTGMD